MAAMAAAGQTAARLGRVGPGQGELRQSTRKLLYCCNITCRENTKKVKDLPCTTGNTKRVFRNGGAFIKKR